MKEVTFPELLEKAEQFQEQNTSWHHHFLTPACEFNPSEDFQIILENEKTSESFFCNFDEKPMEELEQLENLFFKRD